MKITFQNVLIYICLLKLLSLQNTEAAIINNFNIFKDKTEIFDATINLTLRCFSERDKHLVLAGNFETQTEHLVLKSLHSSLIPVSLIGEPRSSTSSVIHIRSLNVTKNETEFRNRPAANFLVVAPTRARLIQALTRIRESIWWNHEGVFLLVNTDIGNDGCETDDCLRSVWALDVLAATLLCLSHRPGLELARLHTFNPFSGRAPMFWNPVPRESRTDDSHKSGDAWTLFEHTLEVTDFLDNSSICENLRFPKTTNLHGYPIRIGLFLRNLTSSHPETRGGSLSSVIGEKGQIARVIWSHLNATANLTYYSNLYYGNGTGDRRGIFEDLLTSRLDYTMTTMFQRSKWRRQTYPYASSGLCAIARTHRVSAADRFLKVFALGSWFVVGAVALLGVLLLKLILGRAMSVAALELVRMIVGMSSRSEPRSSAGRKFFAVYVFAIMGATSYFESRMNAMYIAPDSDPTIDTAADLAAASELRIHGHVNFRDLLVYPGLRERYHPDDNLQDCIDRLRRRDDAEETEETKMVCLYPCVTYNVTEGGGLHVAKNPMRDLYLVFMTRENWPLTTRVNEILMRMAEAGLFAYFEQMERILYSKYKFMWDDEVTDTSGWRAVNMTKASATFLMLVWSSTVAGCIFVAELAMYSACKRIRKLECARRAAERWDCRSRSVFRCARKWKQRCAQRRRVKFVERSRWMSTERFKPKFMKERD